MEIIIIMGFILDLLIGDPYFLPHPIRLIGRVIQIMENILRRSFPKDAMGEKYAGISLAILVPAIIYFGYSLILMLASTLPQGLYISLQVWLCYQLLAARCLADESNKVRLALLDDDIEQARKAVSMIVGRDTDSLDAIGITKAAIETIAENLADAEIAPLFFLVLGGIPLMACYKAVNTLDSMVGYKNEKYFYFGWASAKLDDLWNYLPARISGILIIISAFFLGYDGQNAWRIFWRDRYQHKSPNSAQSEAACAGALSLQLAGPISYGGIKQSKPTIGDAQRLAQPDDILRANKLMICASFLGLFIFLGIRGLIIAS